MRVVSRRLRFSDFDECWRLCLGRGVVPAGIRERVMLAWKNLLQARSMRGMVVTTDNRDRTVVAFGASVFVRRDWFVRFIGNPRPYEPLRRLAEFDNIDSPILCEREIAEDNAGDGLNLLVVHNGWEPDMSPPGLVYAGHELIAAFQRCHAGYRIREMLNEIYGGVELDYCTTGGNWFQHTDFSSWFHQASAPFPREEDHPYLLGARPDRCPVASVVASMFACDPPILGLTARQRIVFALALEGMSNSAIAAELNWKVEAVRNCFRTAYEKVRAHRHHLFLFDDRQLDETIAAPDRTRNRLLQYLSSHQEELRPWPRRQKTGLRTPAERVAPIGSTDWLRRTKDIARYRTEQIEKACGVDSRFDFAGK